MTVGKTNIHKKIGHIDKFARKFYCQRARLNSIRGDKRASKKKVRATFKKELNNYR